MSRKILEGSYEIVYISPESLFTGKHGERLSTHTHAFGTYYVIKHFTADVESAINYRPPSIIGRAHALTLVATNKLIIAKDRWVNVG